MKKRCCTLLLTGILLLQFLPLRADAEKYLCFTAANETILELKDETMPFWVGEDLYVSAEILNLHLLGVSCTRSQDRSSAILYRGSFMITSNLQTGETTDTDGKKYYAKIVERNGQLFIPTELLRKAFDLSYSYQKTEYGDLLRFRSADSVLDDTVFLDAAPPMLSYRYHQYQQAKTVPELVAPTVVDPSPTVTPTPSGKTGTLFLLLRPEALDGLSALSTQSAQAGCPMTVFLDEAQLRQSGDLLRQLFAQGHTVGIALQETLPQNQLAEAERCNNLLYAHGIGKTRFLLDATDTVLLTEAGYCCCSSSVERTRLSGESQRSALLRQLSTNSILLLRLKQPASCSAFLPQLTQQFTVRPLWETSL